MRTMITLGLAMFTLLLVGALRRTETSPHTLPGCESASTETQRISTTAKARRAASPALRAAPSVQSIHVAFLAAVEAEPDPDRRSEALEWAVEFMAGADWRALLDSLARDGSPGAGELLQWVVGRWADSDAPAAAAWTSQLPEGPVGRAACEQVAIAWANADLPAAAGWVQALPEGDNKQAATLGFAYEAARTEPVMALELASTLAPTRERDALLVHAVRQWGGIDSAAALVWALEVSDRNLRQHLAAAIAVASAERDGTMAATLAAQALDAGDEQARAVVSIVQRWVQQSPHAAAAWIEQFPDSPARVAAAQNLITLWTAQDAGAAGDWLLALPAGSLREAAMTAHAQAMADGDRVAAVSAPAEEL